MPELSFFADTNISLVAKITVTIQWFLKREFAEVRTKWPLSFAGHVMLSKIWSRSLALASFTGCNTEITSVATQSASADCLAPLYFPQLKAGSSCSGCSGGFK